MSLVQAPAGHILPPPQAPLETEVAPPPVSKQIAREAVAGERAALPPEPPTGRGMMIAGGSMVGGGILLSLLVILIAENAGGWCWAEDAETQMLCVERAKNRYGRYLGLVPAGVIFAGGIALVAVGGHRQSRWYRWKQNQTVAPNTSRTVFGTWTAGMTLRF